MAKDNTAIPSEDVEDVVKPAEESAEEVENEEPVETPTLERDNVMADIARRQREKRDAKVEEEDDDPADEPVSKSDPKPADPKPPAEPDLVPLKVEGRTIYRTQQQIDDAGGISAIQKSLAGDFRLEDAARRKGELDQRELDIQERERQIQQRLEDKPKPPGVKQATPEEIRALAEDLVVGDVDKVAATLAHIMPQNQQQQPQQQYDPEAIARQASQMTRKQIAEDNAREQFAKDFPDIYTHDGKRHLANQHTITLMRENPDWTPAQILTEAGKRTRADLGIEPKAPKKDDTLVAKQHRKAATVDSIPQATARKVDQPTDYKPDTPRQIFEKMQAKRSHQ